MNVLRRGDGFADRTLALRPEVKNLQRALCRAGFMVDIDGFFGRGTEDAIRMFQREEGLSDTGVLDAETRECLMGDGLQLEGFHGDLSWVHEREGHVGRPYWPGGASGITLDPGVDLGYADMALVDTLYAPFVEEDQMRIVRGLAGLRGEAAKEALESNRLIREIRVSREAADAIFPHAAIPYWRVVAMRFAGLEDADVPPAVHTVMLSLSYNRGGRNRALDVLATPIREKDWRLVGELVSGMQQDHKLEGIRKRRRMEGALIRNGVA